MRLPDRFAYFCLDEDTVNPRNVPRDRLLEWLSRFTIVVCKATLNITALQDALPGVRFIAYLGGRHIPQWFEEPFADWEWPRAHAARFDSRFCLWDLKADRPFSTYDFVMVGGKPQRRQFPCGMVQIMMTDEMAKAYQELWLEVVAPRGFRHAYVDSYEQVDLTDYARYELPLDTDGDRVANDPSEISERWNDGDSDVLSVALRETLGPAATIIGNSGRRRVDPSLSGITLEEYPPLHMRFPDWFRQQWAIASRPGFNVYWVKSPTGLTWLDAAKDQGKMPMVLHGQMADKNAPEVRPGLRNPRFAEAGAGAATPA